MRVCNKGNVTYSCKTAHAPMPVQTSGRMQLLVFLSTVYL